MASITHNIDKAVGQNPMDQIHVKMHPKVVLNLLKAPSMKFKKPNHSYKLETKFTLSLEDDGFLGEEYKDVDTAVSITNFDIKEDENEDVSPILYKKPLPKASNSSVCKYYNHVTLSNDIYDQQADTYFQNNDSEEDDDLFGPDAQYITIHGEDSDKNDD